MSAPVLVRDVFAPAEDRASWLQARRAGVGASELPALLGVDMRRDSLVVYADKVADVEPDEEFESEDDPRFWGRRFENPVAEWYAEKTGRVVTNPGAFAIKYHPTSRLFATLDRDVYDRARDRPDSIGSPYGVLECKAVTVWGPLDLWKEEPPLCYQVQLQAQLAVTGRQWGSIAAILGGARPVYYDFERNDEFIAAALRAVEQFWERVERRDPPPPGGSRETRDALRRLWPKDAGTSIVFPAEKLSAVQQWERAKEAESAAKAWREDSEEVIKAEMKDATWAYLPDGRKTQWKVEARKGHTVKPSEPRVLRLVKA